MLLQPISIVSLASVSPLGLGFDAAEKGYARDSHKFKKSHFSFGEAWVASLHPEAAAEVDAIRSEEPYRHLDKSVLMAIAASRMAVSDAGWTDGKFGINIGSSRGATAIFENHHKEFLETGYTHTRTSPTTTLGNISSWVAQDLMAAGPDISHSITCSTSLHALLNGIAWIQAGMADRFLVGGSEAPLTSFTIAQMNAMKIYSKRDEDFPCRAMDFGKRHNSMILGEAASVCCLEAGTPDALARISGIGYATEKLTHSTSISADAECFQKSMSMAIEGLDTSDIDAIVMHAPGTIAGDKAEQAAIEKVFGNNVPLLTGNKWKIGHTFGASGMLSVEMAVAMIRSGKFIGVPFLDQQDGGIKRVLVNSVGFGGNAVSIVVESR